ncbi:hypothetical protein KP509_12G064600 [Ceratopteris richardii]|uniref:Uncharacterized protein n=1 Tax=Ceratopteris richardii TaxID=49495 RepID=A0A8T2TPI6_CERRI|nr:hypothetical protein KP509_12G064600 [Ceratopteris richardii]
MAERSKEHTDFQRLAAWLTNEAPPNVLELIANKLPSSWAVERRERRKWEVIDRNAQWILLVDVVQQLLLEYAISESNLIFVQLAIAWRLVDEVRLQTMRIDRHGSVLSVPWKDFCEELLPILRGCKCKAVKITLDKSDFNYILRRHTQRDREWDLQERSGADDAEYDFQKPTLLLPSRQE